MKMYGRVVVWRSRESHADAEKRADNCEPEHRGRHRGGESRPRHEGRAQGRSASEPQSALVLEQAHERRREAVHEAGARIDQRGVCVGHGRVVQPGRTELTNMPSR